LAVDRTSKGPPLSYKDFPTQSLDVDVEHGDGPAVVRPRGELDLASAPKLRAVLQDLRNKKASVRLELKELTFLDSSGLRLIWETDAAAREDGLTLTLSAGPPQVMRVFELTGLRKRLNFTDGG
jgi:anti-sigma B factor antagonist